MTEAGIRFSWAEFNAQHAFLRDEGPRYDPELALRCYGMAVDLFWRKLGQGGPPRCGVERKSSRRGIQTKCLENFESDPQLSLNENALGSSLTRKHKVAQLSTAGMLVTIAKLLEIHNHRSKQVVQSKAP